MIDELTLLREVDPAGRVSAVVELDDRAERDFRAITDPTRGRTGQESQVGPRGIPWRWAGGVVVLTLIVTLALTLGGGPHTGVAFAATPPLLTASPVAVTPSQLLDDLAARAGRAEDTTGRGDQVVRTQSWSLFTRVDGAVVHSAVVPVESELRWGADLSGSLRRTTGTPTFPDKASGRAWSDAGQPGRAGTVLDNQTYAPGGFAPSWRDAPPTDLRALADYLAIGHPIKDLGTAELFVSIADLERERELSPTQQSAILRLVAEAPDVQVLGAVRDRLQRPGLAVSTDSDYSGLMTRHILVFDPTTGALNAEEQWLTTSAGALNVPVPSVISYTAWRR